MGGVGKTSGGEDEAYACTRLNLPTNLETTFPFDDNKRSVTGVPQRAWNRRGFYSKAQTEREHNRKPNNVEQTDARSKSV